MYNLRYFEKSIYTRRISSVLAQKTGVVCGISDVGEGMDLAPIDEGKPEDEWAHQDAGNDISGDVGKVEDLHEAGGKKPHQKQGRHVKGDGKEIDSHNNF